MTDFSQHDSHKEVIDRHAEYMTEGNSQYLPGPAGADAPEVNTAIDPHGLPKTDHDRYDLYQKEAVAAGHQNQQASGQSGWRRRSLKFWIILVLVVIAVIVGVVVGAVVGTQNAEGEPQEAVTSPPPIPTPTVPAPPVPTPTEPSSPNSTSGDFDLDPDEDEGGDAPPIETPSAADISMGIVFNSTFTFYGTDDGNDSENCSTPDTSCGFFASSGYASAVSENLFGAGPLDGEGIACGTCWRLNAILDSSGNEMNETITVVVNEICPAENNPICGQQSLDDVNGYNAQVDFNLCRDSGASDALFGGEDSGIGLAFGFARRIPCGQWDGEQSQAFEL